ncbi:MAG: transporter [Gemmatimonadota bacterium]|nr:MAG: transporter [Gemmatimonadota bacterium]
MLPWTAALAFALTWTTGDLLAQELEPRAFSQVPVGLNFGLLSYGYSKGNVLFDQALPVEDANARLNSVTAIYVRAIDAFGLSGKIGVILPFAWGTWEGRLEGQDTSTSRTGFGDLRVQLAVNFIGAPAMAPREFATYSERTIVGAALQIVLPTGQYDPDKLINLGSNRWAFRPRIGVSHTVGRWTLEIYGDVWLHTDNTDFYGGSTLEQGPFWVVQGHVLYNFRRGLWLGLNAGYANGGQTTVDGNDKDFQENTRLGATLALPLGRRHGLKLVAISGIATRLGADFDTINLAYQYRWGGGL